MVVQGFRSERKYMRTLSAQSCLLLKSSSDTRQCLCTAALDLPPTLASRIQRISAHCYERFALTQLASGQS